MSESDNLVLRECKWTYPETVEEFCLFGFMFLRDDTSLTTLRKYEKYFQKAAIGLTVRRGDFLNLDRSKFRVLSPEQLNRVIDHIRAEYTDNYNIIVTSTDIE